LSGLALVNTSNVVLKAVGIPEWRKIFEAEDSDFGAIEILERLESANFEAILRRARHSLQTAMS